MSDGSRKLQRSWLPWIPLAAVVLLALAVGAFGSTGPATNEERVLAIAKTLKCQTCRGESVAESNADTSRDIVVGIAQQVEQGRTDDEIRDFYIAKYPGISLIPTSSGLTGLVWILPVVVLVLSLAGLAVAFRRWNHQEHHREATDEDRALVRAALDRQHAAADGPGAPPGVEPGAEPDDEPAGERS